MDKPTILFGSQLEPRHIGRTVRILVGNVEAVGTLQAYARVGIEYAVTIGGQQAEIPVTGVELIPRTPVTRGE
jgi:hypothetical protein